LFFEHCTHEAEQCLAIGEVELPALPDTLLGDSSIACLGV
jgi:hypothetical protein